MHVEELVERVVEELRRRQRSESTVAAYAAWVRRWGRVAGEQGPWTVVSAEEFLDAWVAGRDLALSTWVQARCALRFALGTVLAVAGGRGLAGEIPAPVRRAVSTGSPTRSSGRPPQRGRRRRRRPPRPPVRSRSGCPRETPQGVLTAGEVARLLAELPLPSRLVAALVYGGLRLHEALELRVEHVDPRGRWVRAGSGGRRIPLPRSWHPVLVQQRRRARSGHAWKGKGSNFGAGTKPGSRQRQGRPEEAFLFPARRGARGHRNVRSVQRALHQAARDSGLSGRASSRILRRSAAVHLLEAGFDSQLVRRLLGLRSEAALRAHTRWVRRRRIASPLALLELDSPRSEMGF
ncbi:MAG: tyrosine-type recombinase/integrase [Acidobacteriota bacterium]|nr:tyrosine-type recombinase/integrase [Acidobacteriota bacterium]